ncbi:hypothetical protein BN946_scf185039.g7 [Trametes cinnabarina]|uniref:Carboxylic ester hydrolase n=1 Tax=Pycnoporus cinnabarinus TaxID=5643 RepID=A0A060SNN3_PYCCI|nr:hypothetical protein BN946_scf185039.g7 [Trametes cinnabarina]
MHRSLLQSWSALAAFAYVAVAASSPTVTLDKATVIGTQQGSVTSYFGIPYAEPPVGDLRLRPPQPVTGYNGTIDATAPATQCPQLLPAPRSDAPQEILEDLQAYFVADIPSSDAPQSEDCLSISVQIPSGTNPGALPVLVFLYDGGFTFGSTAATPGNAIVERSVELGQPIIYVNINYRLGAFGSLGGQEIKEAGVGNLGLQDQRVALRWIKQYISAFGGDPSKVTIWGFSSGAISVAAHMITNGGNNEGLFRAGIMNSGSPTPTGDIEILQPFYDTVVANAGCAGAADTLECLRTVSTETLLTASAALPNILSYSGVLTPWIPRADGVFLEAPLQHLVLAGSVANVPFITGDTLDEGTLSATGSFNITTDQEFRDYIHQTFLPSASEAEIAPLFELYPDDPAAGSPFGTGDANQLAPQYKRMAAFQGDAAFQAPRRFFLDQRSSKQPAWSFVSQQNMLSGLGFPHGSDVVSEFAEGGDALTDYFIQFTATLDPNGGASERTINWPKYDSGNRSILEIIDGTGLVIGTDNARSDAIAVLTNLSIAHPV